MSLSFFDLEFLQSERGTRLLERLAHENLSDNRTLALLAKLRQEFTLEQAGAALSMARLRLKAVDKFGADAGKMFFTSDALEQASDPNVRRYRAKFAEKKHVLDVCCGIGTDAMAMGAMGADVLGLDIDPVRIAIAQHNAMQLGFNCQFQVADIRDGLPADSEMAFFDPARRDEAGKRIFHVEQYQPSLSLVRGWRVSQVVVKLSPGVRMEQLVDYHGGVEFISVHGDLKEAVLWLKANWIGTQATLINNDGIQHWRREGEEPRLPLSEPHGWLVEPDAAIIRAGLVQDLGQSLNGQLLDETIAYLITEHRPNTAWVRAWQIVDWLPFNLKKLREYLRKHNVGHITVKKRGSAVTPEAVTQQLKLKGDESRTLVLTRCKRQQIIVVCMDIR